MSKAIIKWREGSRFSVDAETAHRELEAIRAKEGSIDPENVVKAAKAKRNALHPEFDWNDATAAHKHRTERARALIRSIVVIRAEAPKVQARKYEISIQPQSSESSEPQKRVYRTTEEILADPIERDRLLARAIKDLGAFRQRYAGLSELAVVFYAIDDTMKTA